MASLLGVAVVALAVAFGFATIGVTASQCVDACGPAGVSQVIGGCGGQCVCKKAEQP